jgi:F-box and WD-40 domain protein 1/11
MVPETLVTNDEVHGSSEQHRLNSSPRLHSYASTSALNWQPGKLKSIHKLPAATKQKLSQFINRTFVSPFHHNNSRDPDLGRTTQSESTLAVPEASHHTLHYARSAYSFVSGVSSEAGRQSQPTLDSMTNLTKWYSWSTTSSPKGKSIDKPDNESRLAFLEQPDCSGRINFVLSIPSEIVVLIFYNLDIQSLASCCAVSRDWKQIVESNTIWRYKFNAQQVWRAAGILPDHLNWKNLYKTRHLLDKRWSSGEATPKALAGHSDSVYCVHFDNQKIVTGSRDRIIKVWDSESGDLIHTLGGQPDQKWSHTGSVLCLAVDDNIMVSGSSDWSCIIWQLPEFMPVKQIFRHSAGVLDVCVDENHIISCSKDSTIIVWDRTHPDYPIKYQLKGHRGPVNALNIRGDYVFSAGGDGIVKMWDLLTGTCVRDFRGHTRGLACVQVSGNIVISAGNDKTIRTWNIDTGQCVRVLEGHKCLVRSLHIFAHKIISGSYDQTIQIWDLNTGRLICNLAGSHGSWIFSAKADCKRIISTSFGTKPVILDFSDGLDKDYLKYIDM